MITRLWRVDSDTAGRASEWHALIDGLAEARLAGAVGWYVAVAAVAAARLHHEYYLADGWSASADLEDVAASVAVPADTDSCGAARGDCGNGLGS